MKEKKKRSRQVSRGVSGALSGQWSSVDDRLYSLQLLTRKDIKQVICQERKRPVRYWRVDYHCWPIIIIIIFIINKRASSSSSSSPEEGAEFEGSNGI